MFYAILALVVAGAVGLDQLVKWLTIQYIPKNTILEEPILGLFRLAHYGNTGAAWSMLEGKTWFFLLVLGIFVVVLGIMVYKKWFSKKPKNGMPNITVRSNRCTDVINAVTLL